MIPRPLLAPLIAVTLCALPLAAQDEPKSAPAPVSAPVSASGSAPSSAPAAAPVSAPAAQCPMAARASAPAGHCPLAGGKPCDEECKKKCREAHGGHCPMAAGSAPAHCGEADEHCKAAGCAMAEGKPCTVECKAKCKKAAGRECGEGHHEGCDKPAGSSAPAAEAPVRKGDGRKTCPVSGDEIEGEHEASAVMNGRKVRFCCPDCVKEAKEQPAVYFGPEVGEPAP